MTRVLIHGRALIRGGDQPRLEPGLGVLAEGERILDIGLTDTLVPVADEVADLGDAVIVPGLIDGHTHITCRHDEGDVRGQQAGPAAWQTIRAVPNLRDMVRSGVTTARVMSEDHDIDLHVRAAVSTGEIVGPALRVSGLGFGGHGPDPRSPNDLRDIVRDLVDRGVDHIKVFAGGRLSMGQSMRDPNYSHAQLQAIVDTAHEAGLKVGAHAHGGRAVDIALTSGVDAIEHGSLLTDDQIVALADTGTWLVLTTSALLHGSKPDDGQAADLHPELSEALETMAGFGESLRARGVKLAVGTDAMHGHIAEEAAWLVDHGWSAASALKAVTRAGAELLAIEGDVGELRVGHRADLLAVDGDPLNDIRALGRTVEVWKAGDPLWRSGRGFVDGSGRFGQMTQRKMG